MLVQQLAESPEVAALQGFLTAIAQGLDIIEVAQHVGVPRLRPLMLVVQDAARGAVKAGEKKQQIVLEVEHRLSGHAKWLDGHPMIPMEGQACNAAEGRDELI